MEKTVKLNGAIRALYKSKAKERIAGKGSELSRTAKERLPKIIQEIEAHPDVKPLVAEIAAAEKAKQKADAAYSAASNALKVQTGAEYRDGKFHEFPTWNAHDGKPATRKLVEEYKELKRKMDKEESCACHIGDSPEVLQFVADLSLCKTVGEAETLLAKL